MNIIIVNCFETYEERVNLVKEYLISNGHNVKVIESNFEHMKKEYRKNEKKNHIVIKVPEYKKNFSISRLFSHYIFSKSVLRFIENEKPNMVYALIPPNSLTRFLSKFKKNNNDTKIVFDLIDLWPETFPVKKIKRIFPFTYWKKLRSNYLKCSDLIITECNMYKEIIKDEVKGLNCETLYLGKEKLVANININLKSSYINMCYLGSINNLIDIPKIKKLLKQVNEDKSVVLHIIGDGEKKEEFIREIESINIKVIFHGKVYDENEKQRIFDQCHFGLNIMKEQVCVGLTMKSVDYFRSGLPIINSIKYDTYRLIENYKSGINIDSKNIVKKIILQSDINNNLIMRKNVLEMFNKEFSKKIFMRRIDKYLSKL